MTVVKMATTYHELGWAIRRAMSSPGLQVKSQRELAEVLTKGGYPIGQQLVSDYMRTREVKDPQPGEPETVPRVLVPMEFVAALISVGRLDDARREDVISGWLEILPEKRRQAVLGLCEHLRGIDTTSPAWREMLSFEEERQGNRTGGRGDRETGGRAS